MTPAWSDALVHLEKLHGAANDFLFCDLSSHPDLSDHAQFDNNWPDWAEISRSLCQRRTGLGADGLILWRAEAARDAGGSPARPRLFMAIFNADGSMAETCGNALRCFGLLLRRHGLWDGQMDCAIFPFFFGQRPVDSGAGAPSDPKPGAQNLRPFAHLLKGSFPSVPADVTRGTLPDQGRIAVDMGPCRRLARPTPDSITPFHNLLLSSMARLDAPRGTTFDLEYRFVQLANPHFVVVLKPRPGTPPPCDDLKSCSGMVLALESWLLAEGSALKETLGGLVLREQSTTSPLGPLGEVNLGALAIGPGHADAPHALVVHERGAGVTQACGSGCVAAAYVLRDLGAGIPPNKGSGALAGTIQETFRMPGGVLEITISRRSALSKRADEQDAAPGALRATMSGPAVYIAKITSESWRQV